MSNLIFEGADAFERFTRFVERLTAAQEAPFILAAGASSRVLFDHIVDLHGSSKLQSLAQSTQNERTALGFTANDPLLRDGSLLRDHVERFHEGMTAAVGSPRIEAKGHEYGFTAPNGAIIPPRPVYQIGLIESEPEVAVFLESAIGAALGFGPGVIERT